MEQFICPITKEIMIDPVIALDGYTYERSAIWEWLEQHSTSPMTNTIIEKTLVTNCNIRSTMAVCGYPLKSISDTVYIVSDHTDHTDIVTTLNLSNSILRLLIEIERMKNNQLYSIACCSSGGIIGLIIGRLLNNYTTLEHRPLSFCLSIVVFGVLYEELFYKYMK